MTTPDVYPQPAYNSATNFRTLASAIAVFLGGYLVVSSLAGQLAYIVSGVSRNPAEVGLYFVLQALFAVAVVIGGLLLANAPIGTRLIASGIVVATVAVTLVTQITRLTGAVGAAGIPMSMTLGNAYFMVLLGVGAAWLLVRRARIGWLTLLAAAILIPIPYTFVLNSIPAVITQTVALAIAALIGFGILLAGRPLRD